MSHLDLTLLLVDSLTREDEAPFYFTDLREEIDLLQASATNLEGLELLRPSELYVLLLEMENKGYLNEVEGGHVVASGGRRRARELRRDNPDLAAAADSVRAALV